MAELQRFSKESEEVLNELGVSVKHDHLGDYNKVFYNHCAFLLLKWLLNKGLGYYTFKIMDREKDIIKAIDEAVKIAKKEQCNND